MTTEDLLLLARATDMVLEVQGDKLIVDAPVGTVTAELRSELVRHRPALVALLAPVTHFVVLRGGLIVPLPAILLALDLERRGFRLALDVNEQIVITPVTALTDIDRVGIDRWRLHLAAIVGDHAGAPEEVR